MESGQRRDKDGKIIPRMIINSFLCTFNGTPVFSCGLESAVAANRTCNFRQRSRKRTFRFSWVDDDGTRLPPRKKSPLLIWGTLARRAFRPNINRTKEHVDEAGPGPDRKCCQRIGLLLVLATTPGGIFEISAQQPRLAPIAIDGAASAQPLGSYPAGRHAILRSLTPWRLSNSPPVPAEPRKSTAPSKEIPQSGETWSRIASGRLLHRLSRHGSRPGGATFRVTSVSRSVKIGNSGRDDECCSTMSTIRVSITPSP